MKEKPTQRIRFTVGSKFGVDPNGGKLTNLQLMAAGREAKGHGIYIDERTLETGKEAVDARGGRLKAYVTHNHSGPCSWECADMGEAGSELNIPGFFSSIAVKSEQLIAGEFEFFDAFKKNFAPQYEQLLEMAQKTPDLLGLSIECWGYAVYVGKDGTEYSAEPDDVELEYNGMPALRITDMWAAAFVSDGAATDGLFAKLSRLFGGKHAATDRAALAAALTKFAAEYAAKGDEPDEVHSLAPNESSAISNPTMKIIADLKAKYGSDQKKFAAAMAIVGNTPTDKLASLTVGEVDTQLAALDTQTTITTLTTERDTARTQLATVTGERDTARTQLTAVTTERDDWKRKYEALKASGVGGNVNLGAGGDANGGGTNEPNPWAAGSINYTRQAQLMKSDPARAAALKAAATQAN